MTVGTVTFKENGTTLAGPTALDMNGHATFSIATLSEGIHMLTALYSGSPGSFNVSSGSVSEEIDHPTTVSGTTYCNPGGITIPANGATQPYPSRVFVTSLGGYGFQSHRDTEQLHPRLSKRPGCFAHRTDGNQPGALGQCRRPQSSERSGRYLGRRRRERDPRPGHQRKLQTHCRERQPPAVPATGTDDAQLRSSFREGDAGLRFRRYRPERDLEPVRV